MNTERRGRGASPRPSSAGGTASTTGSNSPSAGQTIRPGPSGVTRSGSRKNATHQMVNGSSSQPRIGTTRKASTLAPAKRAMNGQAHGVSKAKGAARTPPLRQLTGRSGAARSAEGEGSEGPRLDAARQL